MLETLKSTPLLAMFNTPQLEEVTQEVEDTYSRIGIARVKFNEDGDLGGVERLGIALDPETDYDQRRFIVNMTHSATIAPPELDIFGASAPGPVVMQHYGFWGDERCVPVDDPRSNYRSGQALLDHVPIPNGQIHPIPI